MASPPPPRGSHPHLPRDHVHETHLYSRSPSIIENDAQRRGLIAVIIILVLATVGMLCLIILLVLWKNKRDKRKKAALVTDATTLLPKSSTRYERVDERDDVEGGVWSTEMEMDERRDERRGGNGYAELDMHGPIEYPSQTAGKDMYR